MLLPMLQQEALIYLVSELLFTINFLIQQKYATYTILSYISLFVSKFQMDLQMLIVRFMFIEVEELLEPLLMCAVLP